MNHSTDIAQELIQLLKEQGSYDSLPEIVEQLQQELYRNQDISVVSAVEMEHADRSHLEKQLTERWGEHRILYTVDPALLSGFLVKFRDSVIDLSGRRALSSLKQELT